MVPACSSSAIYHKEDEKLLPYACYLLTAKATLHIRPSSAMGDTSLRNIKI